MCTLFSSVSQGLLAKNRDKNEPTIEEVYQDDDLIAVRTIGSGYFGLGLNKYGVGFISSAINTPAWTATAEKGEVELAREIYQAENEGCISPTRIVSDALGTAESIAPLINLVTNQHQGYIGYNVLLMDDSGAVRIECREKQTHVTELLNDTAVTNHFSKIRFGPAKRGDYPSSFDRLDRAALEAQTLSRENLFRILLPGGTEDYLFWREGHFFTVSSSILDLPKRCLHYCGQNDNEYSSFQFD